MLSENAYDAWLRLALAPGLTTRRRLRILQQVGDPQNLRSGIPPEVAAVLDAERLAGLQYAMSADSWPALDAAKGWLTEPGQGILSLGDPAYPRALLDLPDPPVLLYCKGNRELLLHTGLAIVGSRNPTPQGGQSAHDFAAAWAGSGMTVISGLAAGIDAAAHRGALSVGGMTVAVVGTGLDRVYPASNHQLAHQISEQGLLLSEFPLGTPPKAENFPQRNRLIAALGSGCLVVEAALGSGSLITARQSADLGREVFAIPGSIHSPLAKGCHWLIKQGAKLVDEVDDILTEFPDIESAAAMKDGLAPAVEDYPQEGGMEVRVLAEMGWGPIDLDSLVVRTGLTHGALCEILLGLELQGTILVLPGGRYQRAGKTGS